MIHMVGSCEAYAADSITQATRGDLPFDTAKPDTALLTCRKGHMMHLQPKITPKIKVGNGFILFNKEATPWLGVWMDTQLLIKEHLNRSMKRAMAGDTR